MQMNKGIAIGGPLQGHELQFVGEAAHFPVPRNARDTYKQDAVFGKEHVELMTYCFATLNTSDKDVNGPSGSWGFWVFEDVKDTNKTILEYLIASHHEMQTQKRLMRRVYDFMIGVRPHIPVIGAFSLENLGKLYEDVWKLTEDRG